MSSPLVIAHRGDSSRALENSLEAVQLALSAGADMIEVDLRMSEDGMLSVMHDQHTGRTADRNVDIEHTSSQELAAVRLKNGEAIPTFDDVLRVVAGRAGINVEIKSAGAGAAVARLLLEQRYSAYVIASSFREAEVQAARAAMPALPVSVIYDTFSIRHVAEYKAKGYPVISLRKNTVTEHLVQACHAQDIRIFVWTVDDEDEMKRCIAWGVDGIYTNKPPALKELVERHRVSP